jgi:hypothetical protein
MVINPMVENVVFAVATGHLNQATLRDEFETKEVREKCL